MKTAVTLFKGSGETANAGAARANPPSINRAAPVLITA